MLRRFLNAGLSIFLYFLLETLAFIGMSYAIGFWWATALSLATTVLGWLIRPKLWKGCLEGLGRGRQTPITSCYGPNQWQRMAASFLLILPGFLTDAIGLLVLIPPVWAGLVATIGTRFLHFLTTQTSHPLGHAIGSRKLSKAMGRRQHIDPQNTIDIDAVVINTETPNQSSKTQQETHEPENTLKHPDPNVIEVDHKWLS